jgi:hypothetical protein
VLCDVEPHDELAVLCSVAADHQATCHPTRAQQPRRSSHTPGPPSKEMSRHADS